jgi:flagella basal body P-ring formation protein FlgA
MIGMSVLLTMAFAAPASAPARAAVPERGVGRPGCHILTRPAVRGVAIEPDMVEPVACRDQVPAALAFDRSTALAVAADDLDAGAYLGRTVIRAARGIQKGAMLRLVSTAGSVRIERTVTALQPSRGGRVFVRDEDGQVFSARLAGAEAVR